MRECGCLRAVIINTMPTCPHCKYVLTAQEFVSGTCPMCRGEWSEAERSAAATRPKHLAVEPERRAMRIARASVAAPLLAGLVASCAWRTLTKAPVDQPLSVVPFLVVLISFSLVGLTCGTIGLRGGIRHKSWKICTWSTIGLVLAMLLLAPSCLISGLMIVGKILTH